MLLQSACTGCESRPNADRIEFDASELGTDVIADRVLMYPPSDVVANDSPWRFVQWFEPDSHCTPLPPPVTYPAVDASCGENCRLIVNSSPRSGDNFFEQDGNVYANLATVFRFDPRANMATATWRGFIREESRLYCDHAPDSALFFSIQRVAQDQFIMSCAGSNSNRIMTVTPQQVCLTARVGSLAEGPGSNGAPTILRKVRGAYVWLQQVQTFKQNVIILDEGAPAPRFLTDECGCTNYMAVHQDRIAYVRDEMGGTQLWIADPPYREARRVWTATGRSIQRISQDPLNGARIVFEVSLGDEVDPRRGDVYYADITTLDTVEPRNLTNDDALQVWPVIRGNLVAFADYSRDTLNPQGPFSGVAHDQTDLVLLDMVTNRRTIVRAGGPGSRGFSPLFLGDDSVYLPLLGGYLARVSFTRP